MRNKYIRGFCPTLKKPIFAEDGLLVRLRPSMNTMKSDNFKTLCDLSEKFGSGIMEITSRGSLQIRGIKKLNYKKFVDEIFKEIFKGEVDSNSNIVINPFWSPEDKNVKIYNILAKYNFKNLPEKFGFIVDLGNTPCLKNISGDIRIENSDNEKILVRAEGSDRGKELNFNEVNNFVLNMIRWFFKNKNRKINRMSELLKIKKLPQEWREHKQKLKNYNILPRNYDQGQILGTKLGRFFAKDLKNLLARSLTPRVRITPFKMILLEKVRDYRDKNFIFKSHDQFLNLSACIGKNHCENSLIDTCALAHKIKGKTKLKVHITGCEKNCGITKETQILLSGRKDFINFFDFRSQECNKIQKNLNDFSSELFKDKDKL